MESNILKVRDQILNLVDNYSEINFKQKEFIPGVSDVPVSGKVIGSLELKNMVEASLDGWLTTGRFNEEFEKKLAESKKKNAIISEPNTITIISEE